MSCVDNYVFMPYDIISCTFIFFMVKCGTKPYRVYRWETDNVTHASRLVRSSQNFSQKVDLFLILSTLVLRVRGSVPPLVPAATPVDMLCSEAELLAMKETPAPAPPSRSDWDPDRCITVAAHSPLTHYITRGHAPTARDRDRFTYRGSIVIALTSRRSSPTPRPLYYPLMTVVIVDLSKMTLSVAII